MLHHPIVIFDCISDHKLVAMAAQLFNRIGQVGLGLALAGGVVNSALYNGLLCIAYFSSTEPVKLSIFFPFSRRRSPCCNIRSIPRHQTVGGRRRNPFLYSVDPASNYIRHSIAAAKRSSHNRQQRFTKCQHHAAYPVPTGARSAAKNLYHSRCGLRRSRTAVNYHRSVKGCRCAIRCRGIDYTERGTSAQCCP